MGSTYLSSPDQVSPYYPERYIRPLPKRTIRSRLPEEVAENIAYPPNPPSASLPAYTNYDYEQDHDCFQDDDEHSEDCPNSSHHQHHCHHHDDEEDELDSIDDASPIAARPVGYRSSPHSPRGQRHARRTSLGGKSSTTVDGYEAFENTNNKKKRKIPTSGSLSLHQSSLGADTSQEDILSRESFAEDVASDYATSPSGLGVQGAGRGRMGRKPNPRNPLGPSTNSGNVRGGTRHEQHPDEGRYSKVTTKNLADRYEGEAKSDQGIISKLMAKAREPFKNTLGREQENVGVLEQQNDTTPTNSQFTFTCESDSKGVRFPERSLYSPDYAQRTDVGTSHSPSVQAQRYNQSVQNMPYNTHQQMPPLPPQNTSMPPSQTKSRPRRKKGDAYLRADRERREEQQYKNLHHPPAAEDIWICEFCEYESIFGAPPYALIRHYEIKDRRERKRLEEKRRLLEKAKSKGRRGKKQTKANKAANAAAQQSINNSAYDQNAALDPIEDNLDDQDAYDDDPIPMPEPPLQMPSKRPMPGAYDRGGTKQNSGQVGTVGTGGGGGTIK